MKGNIAIRNDRRESLEIGYPRQGDYLEIVLTDTPGEDYMALLVDPDAMPEIIAYLQRAWEERCAAAAKKAGSETPG